MIGIECVEPSHALAITTQMLERGFVLLPSGDGGRVLSLTPPAHDRPHRARARDRGTDGMPPGGRFVNTRAESRADIERDLLDWMTGPQRDVVDADRFERIALALFACQYDACAPYRRLCESLGRTPESVEDSAEIPAVPTGAFKEFDLRCFPAAETCKTFRTSGTSTERRGALHLDRLALYEASLLASLRRCLVPDLVGRRAPMRFLAPSAAEAPDSSLSHMFECLRAAEGGERSGFDLVDGTLELESFAEGIEAARAAETPMLVAGTSFAFVHWLDATRAGAHQNVDWRLPTGSRVMETGGFKGRSREVPRDVLREEIAQGFGIDPREVVNQYGMTELGSQFYDSTWIDRDGPRRKLTPPWTRVRFVDPERGNEVAPGEVGQIVIHDLANTGSIAAIQTADLGRAILDAGGESIGFDVLGRAKGAEARGCSIATDVMLEASGARESRP